MTLHDQIQIAIAAMVKAHGLRRVAAALQRHGHDPGVALALCGEAMQASHERSALAYAAASGNKRAQSVQRQAGEEAERHLPCARCGSEETRRTRRFGKPLGDEQWCTACGHRWEPGATLADEMLAEWIAEVSP